MKKNLGWLPQRVALSKTCCCAGGCIVLFLIFFYLPLFATSTLFFSHSCFLFHSFLNMPINTGHCSQLRKNNERAALLIDSSDMANGCVL